MKKILVFLSVFLLTLSQAFAFTFEYNNKSYTIKDEFIENIFKVRKGVKLSKELKY